MGTTPEMENGNWLQIKCSGRTNYCGKTRGYVLHPKDGHFPGDWRACSVGGVPDRRLLKLRSVFNAISQLVITVSGGFY